MSNQDDSNNGTNTNVGTVSVITVEEKASIVAALKELRKTKPWRDTPERPANWVNFVNKVSEILHIDAPNLRILTNFGAPCTFYEDTYEIVMDKYSLISLLFSIYQVVEVNRRVGNVQLHVRDEAMKFAEDVFFEVYPKKRQTLQKSIFGIYVKPSTAGM